MSTKTKRPAVGVGVVVWHEGYILLGERRGSHGAGELALPGGKVESKQTPQQAAEDELLQETGLTGNNFVKLPFWSFDCYEELDRNYVTLYYMVRWNHSNPTLKEPQKCGFWDWFVWKGLHTLEETLFAGLKELHDEFPNLGQGRL